MIRPAKYVDIPQIVELGNRAHARSRYATKAAVDIERAKLIWRQALSMPSACVIVSDENGINGCIVGASSALYEVMDVPLVMDQFFYVDEGAGPSVAVRLLRALHEWADRTFGRYVLRHAFVDAISGVKDRGAFMRRMGFRKSGEVYEKEVQL